MKVREKEIITLVHEIYNKQQGVNKLLQSLEFPLSLRLDTGRITVAGHSFGGMSAIRASALDKRVRACLVFDPWLYVHEEAILRG